MSTWIYLIRHGATALNREVPYRLQGRKADPPLDDVGRTQAEATASTLAHIPLSAIYSSPMLRAIETARFIGEPRGLEPVVVEGLTEASLGRWEGLTWDEVARLEPEEHSRFMTNPGTVPYAGGESFLDVLHRAIPIFSELARKHEAGRIAVVGHNGLNRAYLSSLMGIPIDLARDIRQSNCGINVIEYNAMGSGTVVTLNSVLHLDIP